MTIGIIKNDEGTISLGVDVFVDDESTAIAFNFFVFILFVAVYYGGGDACSK